MPFSDELREFFYIVWEAVQTIPEGKITSYGHIASLVGSPTRSRQVGLALKNLPTNPELEFNTQNVPWHRVVNAGGKISAR
ncbi:Alkyltransferase-like protein 1 [Ceratocystis pirilliformis]|uniref:Alkyltransferase-like protein 1 n=1 Tax=Ceratocystis pirilliformis TaxID=259994 RepID=A0ABR3Z4F8_9PEZI